VTPEDAAIDAHLREILASDEFRPPLSDRFWQHFVDFLKWIIRALTGLSLGGTLVVVVIAAGLLAALVVVSWRLFGRSLAPSPRSELEPEKDAQGRAPTPWSLAERAQALAADGRLREAARALHQALLLHLCARSGLPWRSTVSDWEWLTRLPPSPPLTEFTRQAERLAFGREPDAHQFASCVRLYDQLVGDR
jgi:hypothetical protein